MSEINYSSTDYAYMEQLREYITEYCQQNGVDPATFIASLDGTSDDMDLRNDPAFQAYWQLAYLQLLYIMNGGGAEMGSVGEVEFSQDALMASYNTSSDEMKALCEQMLSDDPELMAFFAMQTEGTGEANSLLSELNLSLATTTDDSDSGSDEYTDDATREFIAKYASGEGLDWLLEYHEGVMASESSIMQRIAEMDQEFSEITDMFNSGEYSAEAYEAMSETYSQDRNALLAMLQKFESNWSTMMEMYSKMLQSMGEVFRSVTNNLRT